MRIFLKYHLLLSLGLLASAVSYAANPVTLTCEFCGSGQYEYICNAEHDNEFPDHWLWTADPGVGVFDGGYPSADDNGYDCQTYTGFVLLKARAHTSGHGNLGSDSKTVSC
jgi:hypothetical protein